MNSRQTEGDPIMFGYTNWRGEAAQQLPRGALQSLLQGELNHGHSEDDGRRNRSIGAST